MTKVQRIYKKYLRSQKKNSAIDFLRFFMPEMIYRSTKLEGDRVTRKQILSTF